MDPDRRKIMARPGALRRRLLHMSAVCQAAAAGGIFYGQAYSIDPYMGIDLGWKAFIAAVIGGIGSIEGAVLGSFLLAGVEVFTVAYLSSNLKNGIAFGLLILLLLVWPSGI